MKRILSRQASPATPTELAETTSTLPPDNNRADEHLTTTSQLTEQQEADINRKAGLAGAGVGLLFSSLSTAWMFKELIGKPEHFREEPAGQLVNWVGGWFGHPQLVDELLGNTAKTQQKQADPPSRQT